jgi:hypothetical protein
MAGSRILGLFVEAFFGAWGSALAAPVWRVAGPGGSPGGPNWLCNPNRYPISYGLFHAPNIPLTVTEEAQRRLPGQSCSADGEGVYGQERRRDLRFRISKTPNYGSPAAMARCVAFSAAFTTARGCGCSHLTLAGVDCRTERGPNQSRPREPAAEGQELSEPGCVSSQTRTPIGFRKEFTKISSNFGRH